MEYLIVWWPSMAVVGGLIGLMNGRVLAGLVLGFFLGPIGWLIIFFLEDKRRRCPACRGVIDPKTSICPHCRTSLIAPKANTTFDEEPFCVQCGVDGVKSLEMGQMVAVCPRCFQKL
jgi:predicted amidophosphoribosyltransferase